MPVTFVQEADSASSSVTLAVTTAGNTVIVAVASLGPTSATGVTGVTLGGSPDNFTLITPGPSARDATSPNDYLNVSVWADANCASGTAISVAGTGVQAVWAFEFSGLAGMADIAQVLQVATYQDSWMASTGQSTVPAEAWFAVIAAANQTGTPSPAVTSGNGWTLETAHSGTTGGYDWGAVAGYQTVNTVGVPEFNGSFSQPSFSVTVIVTLGAGTPPAPAKAHAPLTANVTVHGDLATHGAVSSAGVITQGGTPVALTIVGPKTGNYTARPGDFVIVEASSTSAVHITFPAGAPGGSVVGVKLAQAAATSVVVQAAGTDVFDLQPGASQVILNTTGATFIAQYQATTGTWYTQSTGHELPFPPPVNNPQPSDLGYVTWSYDPAYLNGTFTGAALPGGNLYLAQCPVRATTSISSIGMWITAGGSGLTAGENFAGVYGITLSTGTATLLATTADLTSSWGSTGLFSATFSPATPVTISPPFVWAAFLANGTTKPSLALTGNQTAGWANGRAVYARFGTVTGPFTSLPSSFDGLGAVTEAAPEYWTALF